MKVGERMAENHFIGWYPRGSVTFYHNVPLDNTYNHSLAFTDRSGANRSVQARLDQLSPFRKNIIIPSHIDGVPYNDISYTRVNNGKIRVGLPADELYDCNYLTFHNQDFPAGATTPKTYFCFITAVEFINPTVTDVSFEVDVIMTWCEAGIFEDCFIEREHTATDNFGQHIQPEDIETGEYVYREIPLFDTYFKDLSIVIAATVDRSGNDLTVPGLDWSGLYSGCVYHVFDDADSASTFLKDIVDKAKSDAIVSVFYLPKTLLVQAATPKIETYAVPDSFFEHDFDGYVPNNEKVFCYPYNFLYVTDGAGHSAEYKFEKFVDYKASFTLWCPVTTNTHAMLMPRQYHVPQTGGSGDFYCLDYLFKSGSFPQLTYNVDTWKRWVASSAVPTAIGAVAGIGQSVFSGNIAGGLLGTISQTVSQVYQHAIQPNEIHGSTGGEVELAAVRQFGIHMYLKQITAGYARVVDNFYDMFGYKSNTLHKPNVNVRPHWTYVKTQGCNLTASMPADAARKVCQIFDNGITFWNTLAEVGQYTTLAKANSVR